MDAATLNRAMLGVLGLARYTELVAPVNAMLTEAACNTVNRSAMMLAQIGEESGSLRYTEELSSGVQYNGRTDLGNRPGTNDGVVYKGRSWIQITGRANYETLSKWAHGKGYVPSPTFFVDHPTELAQDKYAGLGPVWYWTVARNMNSYADKGDIYGATVAVNGGTNGLPERTQRWNLCRSLGNAILPTEANDMTPEETEHMIVQALRAALLGDDQGPFTNDKYPLFIKKGQQNAVLDRIAALEHKVK